MRQKENFLTTSHILFSRVALTLTTVQYNLTVQVFLHFIITTPFTLTQISPLFPRHKIQLHRKINSVLQQTYDILSTIEIRL